MYTLMQDGEQPPTEREYRYPFRTMAVGDSFIIPGDQVRIVTRAAWRHRQRFVPWMFIVAVDTQGCTRLWRLPDRQKQVKGR